MENDKRNRTKGSGEYTFEGGFERACTCGHTLGTHSGERAKVDGKVFQECFHTDCNCECFKPVRKSKAAK